MTATAITGIPNLTAFIIGLIAGVILYWVNLLAMLLGLGTYLPFYMSTTAFIGALIKLVYDKVCENHRTQLTPAKQEQQSQPDTQRGLVVSSGILSGESIIVVIIAFVSLIAGLAAQCPCENESSPFAKASII